MNAPFSLVPEKTRLPSQRGEPTWELALLYPLQGHWTEEEYLRIHDNGMIELSNGCLEFLPMPSMLHQLVVAFLFRLLDDFVRVRVAGKVIFAPVPVWLAAGTYREPDIMYFRPERIGDLRKQPKGADLVMEVVSPGAEARERDMVTKRAEYAATGIEEYWIVDLEQREVTVLTLDGSDYRVHGVYKPGDAATSAMFPEFVVSMTQLFQIGETES